jgi:regulator of replication initiation timing
MCDVVDKDFARQLEIELAASLENQCKAQAEVAKLREAYLKSVERDDFLTQEVDRLTKELAAWDYGTRAEREQKRAEKAEAEVERLKEAMLSCLHITNCYDGNYVRACDNVELIVRNALISLTPDKTNQ